MKITRLTPDQEALIPTVRETWIRHGLSTEPANREQAEAGVRLAYQAAELTPPRLMVWLGSPMAGAVAAVMWPVWFPHGQVHDQVSGQVYGQVHDQVSGQVRGQVYGQVYGQVHDQVRGQVYGQVHDQVRGQVHDQVSGQVSGQVHDQVSGQVYGQVHDQVSGQVRGQVYGQVHDQVRGQVHDQVQINRWGKYLAGNLWASYYAWTDYYQQIGVTGLEPINGQTQVARNAGWWWPMQNACILTDRPDTIHGEQIAPPGWGSHRLHSETGPALHYRDGWAIYAWHGTRVESWVIDGSATVERILSEPNTEVRRCAIESYGWPKFITDAGLAMVGRPVDDPGNPSQTLALYDVPLQVYEDPVCVLLVTNGSTERDKTRRRYGLTTPASIRDPLAAAAWTYDLTPSEYARCEVRR